MFSNVPRRAWYPSAAVAGQQLSNVGFNNWIWLCIFFIFALMMLLLFIAHLYARCVLSRRPAIVDPVQATNVATSNEHPKPGLDLSVIGAIPTFSYCQTPNAIGDSGGKDCAVCLGTIEEGEVVRMLPKCPHLFHVGCIDMWLRSHRTCPVCRADCEPPKEAAQPQATDGSSTGEVVKEGRWRMSWIWSSGQRMWDTEQEGIMLREGELPDIERQ